MESRICVADCLGLNCMHEAEFGEPTYGYSKRAIMNRHFIIRMCANAFASLAFPIPIPVHHKPFPVIFHTRLLIFL